MQYLVSCVIVGLPLLYMQVMLGQYTQMGVILFKHLVPIGHGLAHSFIGNVFLKSVARGMFISTLLVYLLTSFNTELEWLRCPKSHNNTCWAPNVPCANNCLADRNISAYVYFV